MAQPTTVAGLQSVMKDAWTSDRIVKQFYNRNPLIKMIRDAIGVTIIGLQAQVPIHASHTAGYTIASAAGGDLNDPTSAGTAQATFTMTYHYMQVGLELAVLNQTNTSAQSIIAGKDLEMKDAVDFMSRMVSQQLARDGTGKLAECATGGASTTVSLRPPTAGQNGHGHGAIVRGHLQPGMKVDIGSAADTDSVVTGTTITAVDDTITAPTITIGSSVSTTSGTDFVWLANPNSATAASPVLNGVENIVGTTTFGGINPATAGNEYWKAAKVDTTNTTFSLPLALDLQRHVFQKDGSYDAKVLTSALQMQNFYMELQNQVHFAGDGPAMGAGDVGGLVGLNWNGTGVNVLPDMYDSDWVHLRLEDLVMIRGSIKEPTWVSELEGAGGDVRWVQGTTGFRNAVVWPFQIGAQRRNRMAGAFNLQS